MNRQHQIAVWVGFAVGLLLFLPVEEAWAQPTRSKEPVDKPTQRFLPLPDAEAPDRQQQSMMLMQLREWMNREELAKKDDRANPNSMTDAQNALRSLAPLLEGLSPSDLKDLSPELFKKAMSDPQIRKQAEKFLEEYAKNRRMPRAEATDEQNGIPLPPELREWIQAAKEKEKEISNESPSKAGAKDSSSASPAGPSRSRTQPSNPEGIPKRNAPGDSPLGNDQEKFKALQDLFQKLKGANENASPTESSEDASENPFETKSPSGNGSPSLGTAEPSPTSSRSVAPNGANGAKSKPGEEVPASSSRGAERNGMPGEPSPLQGRSNDERERRGEPVSGSADSKGGATSREREQIQEELEQRGLGSALRKILEKTIEEQVQGGNRAPGDPAAVPDRGMEETATQAKSFFRSLEGMKQDVEKYLGTAPQSSSSSSSVPFRGSSSSRPSGASGSKDLTSDFSSGRRSGGFSTDSEMGPRNVPARDGAPGRRSTDQRTNRSGIQEMNSPKSFSPSQRAESNSATASRSVATNSGGSRYQSMASDFWKSISTAPSVRSSSGARMSSPIGNTAWEFRPNRWLVLLLVILVLVVVLLYVMKKQVFRAAVENHLVQGWRELIGAESLRTREDVVVAFHQLALLRTATAATWWTHRLFERKLSQAKPEIRSAMEVLANIYEQARYSPPDQELDAEQLLRARQALQQCHTCLSS